MNNDNSKLPTDLLSVLQVIPVSIMNGKRIVDTYALVDPGSTGTYIVETIAKSIDLNPDRKFNMNHPSGPEPNVDGPLLANSMFPEERKAVK